MNTNLPFAETFTLHAKVVLQTAQSVLSLCPQRLTTLREQAVGTHPERYSSLVRMPKLCYRLSRTNLTNFGMTLTILGRPTYYYSCKRVLLERPSIPPLKLSRFGTTLTNLGRPSRILGLPSQF